MYLQLDSDASPSQWSVFFCPEGRSKAKQRNYAILHSNAKQSVGAASPAILPVLSGFTCNLLVATIIGANDPTFSFTQCCSVRLRASLSIGRNKLHHSSLIEGRWCLYITEFPNSAENINPNSATYPHTSIFPSSFHWSSRLCLLQNTRTLPHSPSPLAHPITA